jgi:hypothetical protein
MGGVLRPAEFQWKDTDEKTVRAVVAQASGEVAQANG